MTETRIELPVSSPGMDGLLELDYREDAGREVWLYWDRDARTVIVDVRGATQDGDFVLMPDNRDALVSFRHPDAMRRGLSRNWIDTRS